MLFSCIIISIPI